MLDIKRIRSNPKEIEALLKRRNSELSLDKVLELDKVRREKLVEAENMKAEQNKVSKQVPIFKKEGKDVSVILQEMKELADKVKLLDGEIKAAKQQCTEKNVVGELSKEL